MASTKQNPLSRQPLKALYTLYFISSFFVRVPFSLVYYIPRSLRPVPSWTYLGAVFNHLFKLWFQYTSAVEFKVAQSLEPGKEGERFVTIKPNPGKHYPALGAGMEIQPEVIGATWYPVLYKEDAAQAKKVVLHFHGGAFVLFTSREAYYGEALRTLSSRFDDALVLCPEYRLATHPTGRFPATVQDAITSYRYLVEDLKIDSSRIILSGDSAGGTIVMMLLRYLATDPSAGLSLPAAALLWSPWLNVSDPTHVERSKNIKIDFIRSDLLNWGLQALTDHSKAVKPEDPYVSPFQAPFNARVPIWVNVGTAETFHETSVEFVNKMQAVGNQIKLQEVHNAPHDPFLGARGIGLQPALEEFMDQIWNSIKTGAQ